MSPNGQIEDCLLSDEYDTVTRAEPRRHQLVYVNVVILAYCHLAAFYGVYLCFSSAMWSTIIFNCMNHWLAALGVIAGTHRLWCHKSYKARTPLQIFLMVCHSLAGQYTAVHWVRDHRLHHKFSDTDADPHNASRGLFFSHIGWLMVKKHPEVIKKGRMIDVSDLMSNPVLAFQRRNKYWIIPLISIVLPTLIPMAWGESLTVAWHLNLTRFIINVNITGSINSFSHTWGYKPFDRTIRASQSKALFIMTFGEGNHNYHHVFPCDYKTDEFGSVFNSMAIFIKLCEALGLAYDLKTVPKKTLIARMKRTGDGTHPWMEN